MNRFIGPLCLTILAVASCGSNEDRLDALEERVVALEQNELGDGALSSGSRALQEAGTPQSQPDEQFAEDEEASAEVAEIESLFELAELTLSEGAFLGVDDEEFGGTTLTGDEVSVSVRLFRSGWEDRWLLDELLRQLTFSDAQIVEIGQRSSFDGMASTDGRWIAGWASTNEEFVLNIRRA